MNNTIIKHHLSNIAIIPGHQICGCWYNQYCIQNSISQFIALNNSRKQPIASLRILLPSILFLQTLIFDDHIHGKKSRPDEQKNSPSSPLTFWRECQHQPTVDHHFSQIVWIPSPTEITFTDQSFLISKSIVFLAITGHHQY